MTRKTAWRERERGREGGRERGEREERERERERERGVWVGEKNGEMEKRIDAYRKEEEREEYHYLPYHHTHTHSDSLGPAVIMCALCYCIERLGVERMVDIFQAVQSIQLQRPGSIKTMKQYAFTYDCVYEYIRTYSSS